MKYTKKIIACLLAFLLLLGPFATIAQAAPQRPHDLPNTQDVAEAYPAAPESDPAADSDSADELTPQPEDEPVVDIPSEGEGYEPATASSEIVTASYIGIVPFFTFPVIPSQFDVYHGEANDVEWDINWNTYRAGTWVTLRPGEIWTDKSVYYPEVSSSPGEFDGTAIVTIYIWGRPFNADGDLLGGNQQISVTTNIGDFAVGLYGHGDYADGPSIPPYPPGISYTPDATGRRISWEIDESLITNPDEPLRIWYHLYLEERPTVEIPEDWKTNFWYSTSGDHFEVRFEPHSDNPIYWTDYEVTRGEDLFEATINWNNGNGLNSATIHDHILDLVISFGSNNKTPEHQLVTSPQAVWTYNATVRDAITGVTKTYYWHLNWETGSPKRYIITVRELTTDASGDITSLLDVSYEIELTSAGGNTGIASSRTVTSTERFRRTYDGDTILEWDSDGRLIFRTQLLAQILLQDPYAPAETEDLNISKEIHGLYEQPWYFTGADWAFTARLMADDYYVVLVEGSTLNALAFSGFVSERDLATVITFTNDTPLFLLEELPVYASAGIPINYVLYEFFTFETLNLLTVEFSFCGNDFEPANIGIIDGVSAFATDSFDLSNPPASVTILNTYDHGIGFLEVHKLLDGFPGDWNVDKQTDFYVRIFDLDAYNEDGTYGNYLLFFPDRLHYVPGSGVSNPSGIPDNPAFNDSFWAVGNHALGLTSELYDLTMIPRLELPVSVFERLRTSNLWTGIRYEVREVTRQDGVTQAQTDAIWENFWENVVSASDRDPRWLGSTWFDSRVIVSSTSTTLREWLEDEWIGDDITGSDYWIPVREIAAGSAGDALWHADKAWNWGVIYNRVNPTSPDEFPGDNPTDYLQFNRTFPVTITNRYKFHGGDIVFEKDLSGTAAHWGYDDQTLFHVRIWTDEDTPRLLVFVPDDPSGFLENIVWRVIGFITADGEYQVLCPVGSADPPANARTILSFSYDSPARLIEVPVHPFTPPTNPKLYTIEEVFPTVLPIADYDLLPDLDPLFPGLEEIIYEVLHDGDELNMPFAVVDDETVYVIITNNFIDAFGNLVIAKVIEGPADIWGMDEFTPFFASIRRTGAPTVPLYFLQDPDTGAYVYVNAPSTYTIPAGDPDNLIPFSEDGWALVMGLTTNHLNYTIVELSSDGTALPAPTVIGFEMTDYTIEVVGVNLFATVTNTFLEAFRVFYDGNDHTGGTAPVDPNNPYFASDSVTLLGRGSLVRADYVFAGWNTEADGSGTMYQPGDPFTMPAEDVTFYAQWTPVGSGGGGTPPNPPNPPDPPPGGFFVEEHIWYLRGYIVRPAASADAEDLLSPQIEVESPHTFEMRPNADITRAEVAMAFYRLLRPKFRDVTPGPSPFSDVNGDEWFGLAVGVLTHWEILEGYEGRFRPHEPITRCELAAVMSRFYTILDTTENPFSDVAADHWAFGYILSVAANGWFIGFPDGTFRPDDNLTRAEFATAVNRMLERGILLEHIPDDVVEFIDLDGTHWAHADFMEAAHTHDWEPHENGITERWLAITGHGLDAAYNQ